MSDYIEKNKKLAVFMGYTYYPFNDNKMELYGWKKNRDVVYHHIKTQKEVYLGRTHKDLDYHWNWNSLMNEGC